MRSADLPFNIELLDNSKNTFSRIRPTTVVDTMDGKTNNFHDDGLFSVLTFGRVGEKARGERFSYIDTATDLIHPTILKELFRLKALYRGILSGKSYAVWNDEIGDFERSNELEGQTGYGFFMSHWAKLQFGTKGMSKNELNAIGDKRKLRIDLINKYRDKAITRYIVIMPAGLRDYTVDEQTGRTTEDEINGIYRKAISISNTIAYSTGDKNDPSLNASRWSLQLAFLEIYEYVRQMLEGKKGFIQHKWARRNVFNGTRNVITSMNFSNASPDGPQMPSVYDTVVGMYQTMKGALPVTVRCVLDSNIGQAFGGTDASVSLINKETLESEPVQVSNKSRDLWGTMEGIEKLIHNYVDKKKRDQPVEIDGYYAGLIFDDGEHFRVFRDIRELPESHSPNHVRPITWSEFFYTATYAKVKDLAGTVTRYPITGIGSIYPTKIYMKTTMTGGVRTPLNWNWEVDETAPVANEMPMAKSPHVDSLQIHTTRLAGLGADFDGDKMSLIIYYTKESLAQLNEFFNSERFFIDPRGGFQQAVTDTEKWVFHNMTRRAA